MALVATGLAALLGISLGMIAGYRGGKTDTFISRLIDIVLSMPVLLLAIGLASVCSISANGCLGGPPPARPDPGDGHHRPVHLAQHGRLVRGQALTLREKEFVEAAHSLGARPPHHVQGAAPNLLAPIVVYATLLIPANILFEAALSFLGVGVPQSTPSWGRMLSDAAAGSIFTVAWWMMLFPGLFLLATTLSFNLVGDGLRDALGPSQR